VWQYRLVILLIWVSVPLSGWFMLRHDYELYKAACFAQREDSLKRSHLLSLYTRLMGAKANRVRYLNNVDDRREWEQDWRGLLRQRDNEGSALRPITPAYFPQTDQILLELEKDLSEQGDNIEQAVRSRGAIFQTEDGLQSLADDIRYQQGRAEFYRRRGAQGIYLLLEEGLAQLEDRYQRLIGERNRLVRETEEALAEADKLQRNIERELTHLNSALNQDEQRTYYEELVERYQQFDLRVALLQFYHEYLAGQPLARKR
jgi:hypothetical protein